VGEEKIKGELQPAVIETLGRWVDVVYVGVGV
jgi:hypothetical protein